MKSVLTFSQAYGKEKVVLRHRKDVEIKKETRKDHIEWVDSDKKAMINRAYIVIKFPKRMPVDWKKWVWERKDDWQLGYKKTETEDSVELIFYDRSTFTWVAQQLEEMGIASVTHRMMFDWDSGQLFPCYVNAHGIWQTPYNIVFMLIQLPFMLYRDYQNDQKQQKSIET